MGCLGGTALKFPSGVGQPFRPASRVCAEWSGRRDYDPRGIAASVGSLEWPISENGDTPPKTVVLSTIANTATRGHQGPHSLPGLSRNSHDFHDLALHMGKPAVSSAPTTGAVEGRIMIRIQPNIIQEPFWTTFAIFWLPADCTNSLSRHFNGRASRDGHWRGRPFHPTRRILNDIGPEIGDSGVGRILDYIGRDHPQKIGTGPLQP